ncbi:MAG TPA: hypothetical protein PKN04_12895, partial [bacterium]|nr:hypothetical protein [bacterium]
SLKRLYVSVQYTNFIDKIQVEKILFLGATGNCRGKMRQTSFAPYLNLFTLDEFKSSEDWHEIFVRLRTGGGLKSGENRIFRI